MWRGGGISRRIEEDRVKDRIRIKDGIGLTDGTVP
jgi:hypothetical protein